MSFKHAIVSLRDLIKRKRAEAHAISELNKLSDRELADMDMTRGAIPFIVKGAARYY